MAGSRYCGLDLSNPPIGKPARLRPGDVVAVVAPSGVVDGERLAAGVALLAGWGLEVRVGQHATARCAYLAGEDRQRLADLQAVLDDPCVRAVFCARGGYGSQRLVPSLDLAALARAPKLVVGFSDVTALLMRLVEAGIVAVHGPMVAADLARGLAPQATAHLRALLSDPDYRWSLAVPVGVRSGRAEGRLLGGCLSVLVTTLGTPWAPHLEGAVLFLEDVNETPYRLDRMLTQLRQSGRLDGLAGLVFGHMAACPAADGVSALDVVRDLCADLRCPIGFGIAAGHSPDPTGIDNWALPVGVRVRLDVDAGALVALESPVV